MRRSIVIFLASLAGFLAVVLPLAGSLAWSWRVALKDQEALLTRFAAEAVARAERVFAEAAQVLGDLERSPGDACDAAHLSAMRDAVVEARYVDMVGHIRGRTIVCTTLAAIDGPIELPAAEFVTTGGERVWFWTRKGSQARYMILAHGEHLVALDTAQFVDVFTGTPDRGLALFAQGGAVTLAALNDPRLDDMRAFLAGRTPEAERIYAAARSARYPLAAVAGESRERVTAAWRAQALTVMPFGLLVAAVLAFGVRRLARYELSLPAQIAHGLHGGEFFVEYQPLVELATGRCIGAEALVRWRHPSGGLTLPDLFIPTAEETGLVEPLTDRVVECVVRDLGRFLAGRQELHIAVNLAAPDLLRERIVGVVQRATAGTGIAPGQIWLEATERGFVNADLAREVIGRFRALGYAVCIDDFGTGFSNLSYLQKFQVDGLKIDKMFVDVIGTGAATSGVIDHIIAMAKTAGLKIVAEGVETAEQAEYLRARGVDYGQGWLFAKALPAPEFIRFVEARNGPASGRGGG